MAKTKKDTEQRLKDAVVKWACLFHTYTMTDKPDFCGLLAEQTAKKMNLAITRYQAYCKTRRLLRGAK